RACPVGSTAVPYTTLFRSLRVRMTEFQGEANAAGNRVARPGTDVGYADGSHASRCLGARNALDLDGERGERRECVPPQIHRRRARVALAPLNEAIGPHLSLGRLDNADRNIPSFEHWPLLDMQFDHGRESPFASALAPGIACCPQRFANADAVRIRGLQGGLKRYVAGEYLRAHQARREARALLIGPVDE